MNTKIIIECIRDRIDEGQIVNEDNIEEIISDVVGYDRMFMDEKSFGFIEANVKAEFGF